MAERDAILDQLSVNVEITKEILVNFIKEETSKSGRSSVVLGLSGGIDSAVVAYLAVEALGAPNVHAIYLPYKLSSPGSLSDARLVTERLGLSYKAVDITAMAEPYIAGLSDPRRKGNVLARMRMIVLFDQSEEWQGLVIGTSNRTEMMLGYGTLHGDLASAFYPLGSLLKTQVRQLARYIDVPVSIIAKPPSADLWENQTDEGELGLTYEEVDKVLFLLLDKQLSPTEIVKSGVNPDVIERVLVLMKGSEFKRKFPTIAPPGILANFVA